jgi:pimeloyl-ACP methyl ester carboxylesterase
MTFNSDGAQIHYEITGEGEPLLWIHGFFGAGADWKYVFGEAPPGMRLIAPDLRGHGASARVPGPFSFARAARDVIALLRHLGIERVKAIGLSGGGITLLHTGAAEPALLDAMVIVSAPPTFPDRARAIMRQSSEAMFSAAELDVMRRRHAGGDAQIQELIAQSRLLGDNDEDVRALLPTIRADTLIVFGDRDPLYPASIACELHAAIRGSHLWVVPNGGHGPIFGDRAPLFAGTALSFLRGDWKLQR